MSRRRSSYAPYHPVERDTVYAAMYGDVRPSDPRDLTVVPPPPDAERWLDGILALAQGVAGAAIVITTWTIAARCLGVMP